MTLHIVASSDAEALAIRDHLVPIVREHGALQDFEDKSSPLRLLVLERRVWRLTHWTPFNALTPGQASSPGYRHALEHQRTRPNLPYGLDVWHAGTHVLSLLWADPGTYEIVAFRRGVWETEAMTL